jgi:gamma-glutamyltranspeptidase
MGRDGRCAIAAPERAAAEAGAAALRAGGNAIDAALAAAAALTVTYPHNCALGGDLFALVRTPDGRVVSLNASGPAPRAIDPDALRRRATSMPLTGADTVTVPGLVAGWGELHARGAALPWSHAFERAAKLAHDGITISPGLARAFDQLHLPIADPGLAATFTDGNRLLRSGERLRQPALAATLRRLAADGPGAFYDGPIADALVGALSARGGVLAADDLRGFRLEVTEPLTGAFGDVDVLTSPPNSSGVLVLQALAALEASGAADPLGADAGLLAGLLAVGDSDRARLLAD